jgi:hypothetical protein
MSFTHTARPRGDVIALPVIWLAVMVSLLIHALLLWGWVVEPAKQDKQPGETTQNFRLRLVEPSVSSPAPPVAKAPAPRAGKPRAQARPAPAPAPAPATASRSTEPVLRSPSETNFSLALPNNAVALRAPSPSAPSIVPTPAPTTPSAPQGDFSALLDARRRDRIAAQGADTPPQPVEDENARRNRVVAANIAAPNSQVFGYDPSKGGGVFQVDMMGYDRAEFLFYGWSKDIRRRTAQRIEVRKGANSDIRIAIVKKMIEIIREHEKGDFAWHSARLGREITLSARLEDNAGLEQVLLREFFDSR